MLGASPFGVPVIVPLRRRGSGRARLARYLFALRRGCCGRGPLLRSNPLKPWYVMKSVTTTTVAMLNPAMLLFEFIVAISPCGVCRAEAPASESGGRLQAAIPMHVA